MNVIGAIFFFICLSFFIVIVGAIILAVYLKNKMVVFKTIQEENEAYHHEPYVDADFYSIGQERSDPVPSAPVADEEVVDTTYRVLEAGDEPPTA